MRYFTREPTLLHLGHQPSYQGLFSEKIHGKTLMASLAGGTNNAEHYSQGATTPHYVGHQPFAQEIPLHWG